MKKVLSFLLAIALHDVCMSQAVIDGDLTIKPNNATGVINLGTNNSSFTCHNLTLGPPTVAVNFVTLSVPQLNCETFTISTGISKIKLQKDLKINCETISHPPGNLILHVIGQGTLTIVTTDGTTGNVTFIPDNKNVFIKIGHQ